MLRLKLSAATFRAAQACFEADQHGEAVRLLDEIPEAHRGWEWRYLNSRLDPAVKSVPLQPLWLQRRSDDGARTLDSSEQGMSVLSLTDLSRVLLRQSAEYGMRTRWGWSAGGRFVYAIDEDSLAEWDAATGERLVNVEVPRDSWPLGLDPTGKNFALIWGSPGRFGFVNLSGLGAITEILVDEKSPGIVYPSLDHSYLMSLTCDGWKTCSLWSASTSTQVMDLQGWMPDHSLVFSQHDRIIVGVRDDGHLAVWSLLDGSLISQTQIRALRQSEQIGPMQSGRGGMSPDDRMIALKTTHGRILVVDLDSGMLVLENDLGKPGAGQFAWSPDSKKVALIDHWGRLSIHSVADVTMAERIGTVHEARTLRFTPDGRQVIVGTSERVQWLEVATSNAIELRTLPGERLTLANHAIISADGSRAILSYNISVDVSSGVPYLWDLESGQEIEFGKPTGSRADVCVFSPDSSSVAIAYRKGGGDVYNARTGAHRFMFTGGSGAVTAIQFSPDSRMVHTADAQSIRTWNVDDGRCEAIRDLTSTLPVWVIHPEGHAMITQRGPGGISVAPADEKAKAVDLKCDERDVIAINMTSDLDQACVSTRHRDVYVYELHTGNLKRRLRDVGSALDYSVENSRIVVQSTSMHLELWDVSTGVRMARFMERPLAARFVSNGETLVSVSGGSGNSVFVRRRKAK